MMYSNIGLTCRETLPLKSCILIAWKNVSVGLRWERTVDPAEPHIPWQHFTRRKKYSRQHSHLWLLSLIVLSTAKSPSSGFFILMGQFHEILIIVFSSNHICKVISFCVLYWGKFSLLGNFFLAYRAHQIQIHTKIWPWVISSTIQLIQKYICKNMGGISGSFCTFPNTTAKLSQVSQNWHF